MSVGWCTIAMQNPSALSYQANDTKYLYKFMIASLSKKSSTPIYKMPPFTREIFIGTYFVNWKIKTIKDVNYTFWRRTTRISKHSLQCRVLFDTMLEDTVLIIDLNFEEMEYHYWKLEEMVLWLMYSHTMHTK